MTGILMSSEADVESRDKSIAGASPYTIVNMSLCLLQVNFRSVYNKTLEFWNLVDTYISYVVLGKE